MQAVPGLTDIGTPIFLAGIVAQFASYVLFSLLVLRMRFRVLPKLHRIEHLGPRVDRILLLLAWSSIWIFVSRQTWERAKGLACGRYLEADLPLPAGALRFPHD